MNYFLSVCFVTLIFSSPGFCQVDGVHLSWNRSGEKVTEQTMAITWFSDHSVQSFVKYGRGKKLQHSNPAQGVFSASMNRFIYKSVLTGLKANTVYYYQCGSDEQGWSELFSFSTSPKVGAKKSFVVGVWGDTQDNEFNTRFEKSESIVQQMAKHSLHFTIHMGDIVNNGSETASWNRLFQVTEPINAVAPFMPVAGNHDVVNDTSHATFQKPFPVFHELFNLPEDNVNYSFDYGNAHFVAISSGFAKEAEKSGEVLFREGSAERRWLEADLAQARRRKGIKWIILYTHYPIYSFGWSHVPAWQHRITPLLDKYNVDLCLAGHRHVYERHTAIRGNVVMPAPEKHLYLNPRGTVYITNGTAGGSPQGVGGQDMPSMVFTAKKKMYNYALMTIAGNTLTYLVYDQDGEIVDEFKIEKD